MTFLKTSEAAELLGMSEQAVRAKAARNELPHYRFGGPRSTYRFDEDELRRWLNDKHCSPAQEEEARAV